MGTGDSARIANLRIMRNSFTVLLLWLVLCLPSWSQVDITSLRIYRQGQNVNISVNLRNRLATVQSGPVMVSLFVRAGHEDSWQSLKVWSDIKSIPPFGRMSRSLDAHPLVKRLAIGPFEAMVQVSAPGFPDVLLESTYSGPAPATPP